MKNAAIAMVVLALAGCDVRPLDDDPAVETGGAGGTVDGAGGAGGAFCGTGGATAPPAEFSREDRFLCLDWPLCPEGVLSPSDQSLGREFFTWCRMQGSKVNCGPCIDTRTAVCAPFVGRCKAPNWPVDRQPEFCGSQVAPASNVVDAFTICTGETQAGPNAQIVCADGP